MNEKLFPCSECGNDKPELYYFSYGKDFKKHRFQIECTRCGIKGKEYKAEGSCIYDWNKRKHINVSGYSPPEINETHIECKLVKASNKNVAARNTLNSKQKKIKKGVNKMSNDKNIKSNSSIVPVKGQITIATQEVDVFRMAETLAKSGYFTEAKDAAKCVVKILAGMELGFGPIASMTGVYISQSGKPCLHANMMAARIKTAPGYDYVIKQMDDTVCEVAIIRNGVEMNPSISFSIKDAEKAGLLQKAGPNPWRKYPKNMLFARVISNAAKWHCPELFSGVTAFTPEELDMPVDNDGDPIPNAEIIPNNASAKSDPKQPKQPKQKTTQKRTSKAKTQEHKPVTKKDVKKLNETIEEYELNVELVQKWAFDHMGCKCLSDLSKTQLKTFSQKLDSLVEHNKFLEIEVNYIDKRLDCQKHGLVSFTDRISDYIKRKWAANSIYDLDENLCKELKDNLPAFEKTVIANIEEKIKMDVQDKMNVN